MELKIKQTKTYEVKYLKVIAGVRYWEDACINGERLESGENVPLKNGENWCPIVDLDAGAVLDWPIGAVADFHFKVCDAGEYYLLDSNMNEVASIDGYVPNGLCHGDSGYGDYIIFSVDKNGLIVNYKNQIDADDWSDEY